MSARVRVEKERVERSAIEENNVEKSMSREGVRVEKECR